MVPGHSPTTNVRILVVGDADVGKSALVRSLCTRSSPSSRHVHTTPRAASTVGCQLSVRRVARYLTQEFYDVGGNDAYAAARRLFYRRLAPFDGILLVHNASDGGASRASIARTFVPEVMATLGDAKAVESGGRRQGEGPHVRARGAANELAVLWRDVKSGYAGFWEAAAEAAGVALRMSRLILNETGVWTDAAIDREVETEMIATSTVPVAVVGLKTDLLVGDAGEEFEGGVGNAADISLVSFDAFSDRRLDVFLKRVGDLAMRRRSGHVTPSSGPRPDFTPASLVLPL